jgi:uncharacterized protein YjbI with pentapeptide repeats
VPPSRRRATAAVFADPKPPRPPAGVDVATGDPEPEGSYQRLAYYDVDLSGREAEAVRFTQCRFRAADLSGARLDQLTLTDCLVQHSNWANLTSDGGSFGRVELRDSRMTGLTVADGVLRDVRAEECRFNLSAWRFTRFEAVHFIGCDFTGADFTGADLRGARFTRCDLTGVQLHQADLTGTRFRGCALAGVGSPAQLRGAVFHEADLPALSFVLAAAMGITIDTD